ncbi:MAG: hypothetical protein A2Y17_08100 [Clostridiales bacterium GWF2_38_85]|nr:MAG: hypothetical protein A2Y17_08100 [Clostridiales bacterium GWF2_38_85]HBL83846.1 hypothetical protein [Clostridiales bacterium]
MNDYNQIQSKRFDMRGLMTLFIGELFVFLYFHINGLDIIPDFVGYIIIAVGLNSLIKYNYRYSQARNCAIGLIFLSLVNLYQNNSLQIPPLLRTISIIIGIAYIIIEIYMIYNILIATAAIADECGYITLSQKLHIEWKTILTLKLITAADTYLIVLIPNLVMIILLIITGFAAVILFLVTLYKSYKTLDGKFPIKPPQQIHQDEKPEGSIEQ